jgi:hypothetical protein
VGRPQSQREHGWTHAHGSDPGRCEVAGRTSLHQRRCPVSYSFYKSHPHGRWSVPGRNLARNETPDSLLDFPPVVYNRAVL